MAKLGRPFKYDMGVRSSICEQYARDNGPSLNELEATTGIPKSSLRHIVRATPRGARDSVGRPRILDDAKVMQVRRYLEAGMKFDSIAEIVGVSPRLIRSINYGEAYVGVGLLQAEGR